MSRVSNALNMYFLLLTRGKLSVKQIANKLEVTDRMVKEYKRDLEMAGIYIQSERGKYGGYYLDNKRSLGAINLTKDEITALNMAKETISSGSYHYSSQFEILVSKLSSTKETISEPFYYNKLLRDNDEIFEKEKMFWVDINLAINQNRKVKIKYKSLKKKGVEVKDRMVNPYGVFDYKGATYFYGFCEKAQDIRFFKLSRVIDYNIQGDKFKVKVDFKFNQVMEKSFGIFNDKILKLKLKITYPMSEIVKEKQISKNQKISIIDDKAIIYEAELKGYTEIKNWILSMGSNVEVIQPLELKKDIIEEITKIQELYYNK